jgi:HPt (histidine-containing phosphotransfer) domain-containing protein
VRLPFIVKADPLLEPLIPEYLRNRRLDVEQLTAALERRDFAALRKLGHNMHGSGGAYGLPPVSELGRRIEEAAVAQDPGLIRVATEDLRLFLDAVKLP